MKRVFTFALLIGCILVFTGCANQVVNEPQVTPTPEVTPDPTPTPTPLPQIAVSQFPEGEFKLGELYPEKITKIVLETMNDNGQYTIVVEDEQKISDFLMAIQDVEVTDSYDPLFLEGFYDLCLSIYDGERTIMKIEEDSDYLELIVENVKYRKKYAIKDEKTRKETAMLSLLDIMFENHELVFNNGMYDIDFVPLYVEGDGYVITGETGIYAWPVFNFETIDFTGYTLSINDEVITEFPKETGEYLLVVDNGVGKYQIKIYVD